jgi:hypothetical protein
MKQLNGLEKNRSILTTESQNSSMDLDKVLIEKIKLDNMKLQEIKEEYEKVLM